MLKKYSTLKLNLVLSFFLALYVLAEVVLLRYGNHNMAIFLAAGIAASYYVTYGKKVMIGTFITILVFSLLFALLFVDSTFQGAFIYSTLMVVQAGFITFVFAYFYQKIEIKYPKNIKEISQYAAVIILTSLITALLPSVEAIYKADVAFIETYHNNIKPTIIGLSVFATINIFSYYKDDDLNKLDSSHIYNLLFISTFSVILYFVTYSEMFGTFGMLFGSFIIVLFMINAFFFNYRMLFYVSTIYILITNMFVHQNITLEQSELVIAGLSIYLVVLVSLTITTKELLGKLHKQNDRLETTNDRLEEMIQSTFSLMSIRDTMEIGEISHTEEYMIEIYEIANKIFPLFSYSACVVKQPGDIKVLSTKGYKLETIRSMKIQSSAILWITDDIVHSTNIENHYFKKVTGKKYSQFENILPTIIEEVRMVFKIGPHEFGGVIFDIPKDSKYHLTDSDIENMRSFHKLINSFYEMNELSILNANLRDDIVLSLIRTLELYDTYTGSHSEDVANLAKMVAEKLELPPQQVYEIYWAGILHDIGKIGVNSAIINKKSKLTLDEYEEVKNHPLYGYQILTKSKELKPIAKLVKHHHEWYNGGGYPDGLTHDRTPFGSQILQIADSVSAMATGRLYAKSKTFESIVEELNMYKGVQFNPKLAEVMITLIETKEVEKYYNEREIL